jgi:hypothetical protein
VGADAQRQRRRAAQLHDHHRQGERSGAADPRSDAARARALLGQLQLPADDDWIREPVSTWVNKADHDDPTCIAPEMPPTGQGRLFD